MFDPPINGKYTHSSGLVDGVVRVSIFVNLPSLLREFGHDPARIVADVGLDLSVFDDPDQTIAFVTASHLLKLCVERTGCGYFGLLLGQRGQASDLGLVGELMQNSPDVGVALRNLLLHLHLQDRGAVPTLSVRDGVVALGYAIYQAGVVRSDQIYDAAIALGFNILRALCGSHWTPTEILFSHSKPDDLGPYRRFFRSQLRFDAEQTAIVFPSKWLERRLPGADPRLRQILEAHIEALEAAGDGDIVVQLRRVLRTLLVSGRGSMEQVAQIFSMHRRTLNRRLRLRRTTFKALLEEMRFEISLQLLRDTELPVVEIAASLDYADASAFTRAFRRWSGTTPAAWRAQRASA